MASELTLLIGAASRGEPGSAEQLWTRVYKEVHALAESRLRRERPLQTIQATELVSEVCLKVRNLAGIPASDRRYFFGMVANAMAQVLAEHARARNRLKRGAGTVLVSLSGDESQGDDTSFDGEALDDSMRALQAEDPVCWEVVRLKVYAGLTAAVISDLTGRSIRSVDREWQYGRRWLAQRLSAETKR